MKVKYKDSLKYKLRQRISEIPGDIILRSDIADLSDYRQINRALKALIKEGDLGRISFGIYAKTQRSKYSEDTILKNDFDSVTKEALNRLGITWDLTKAQKAYNEGKTQQVPVRPGVRLKSRCRRSFSFRNLLLRYEDGAYAK